MKYCSEYGCGRLLPVDHSSNKCPYCGYEPSSLLRESKIKELPSVAFDVEMKCRICGSTEDLSYSEQRFYGPGGKYSFGNDFTCKSCNDEAAAENARQEAMQYFLVADDDFHFFDSRKALEDHMDDLKEDADYEYLESIIESMVILKVEKISGGPCAADFKKRNVFYYEDEFYKVEQVIEPTMEYDGDLTITL